MAPGDLPMSYLRFSTLCAWLLLSGIAFAGQQKYELKFMFAGAAAGQETVETRADGSFESKSSLSLMGQEIVSDLSGKIENGKLVSFTLHEKRGPQEYTISASGSTLKLDIGGKTQEAPFKAPTAFFANFHPWLSHSVRGTYDMSKGGSQDVEVYILEANTEIKLSLTLRRTQSLQVGTETKVVQVFSVRFPTLVEMDVSMAEGGPVVAWDVPAQKIQAVMPGYEKLTVDPTTLYPELSQPQFAVDVDNGVKARMADGVELVADVYRPKTRGKYPVILVRTPYGRGSAGIEGDWWAKRGYVYVVQDVRGRFDSGGTFEPMMNERKDGVDTLNWLTKQSWCNGKVGMIGGSYLGYVQWMAAISGHPALKCIVPQVAPPDMFFNIPYDHGVFMLYGAIWWANVVKDRSSVEVTLTGLEGAEHLATLPLNRVDDKIFGRSISFYDKWLKMDKWSDFAAANYYETLWKVKIPALHISGWWDGDGIGTKMNWEKMRTLGRTNQWLVYGPWTHFFNSSTKLGDTDYGPDAVIDLQSLYLRWFDTWLKDKKVGLTKVPRAKIFVTGANEWRDYADWPPAGAKKTTYYLSSPGTANKTPGTLTTTRPASGQKPDVYRYDPAKSKVSGKEGDVREATTKVDITDPDTDGLVYRTAPLKKALDLGGPISLDLYFSTSAKDTDFFAMLVDIDSKGEARLIGQPGKIRAKYISGWNSPKLLTPGRTYKASIELWDTAHRFAVGHRIGLLILSASFPSYARNLNTGESYATGTKMVVAKQTIFHDRSRPSALKFYALPPK